MDGLYEEAEADRDGATDALLSDSFQEELLPETRLPALERCLRAHFKWQVRRRRDG